MFKTYAKKRREVFVSHIKDTVIARFATGRPITYDEYSKMRMNSYERRFLFPLFNDETLIEITKYALGQEGNGKLYKYSIPKHYTEAVLKIYIHELMDRFQSIIDAKNKMSKLLKKNENKEPWENYQKTNTTEMRPYVEGEDLTNVSVNSEDTPGEGGMIARSQENHDDQWYVAKTYFEENYKKIKSKKEPPKRLNINGNPHRCSCGCYEFYHFDKTNSKLLQCGFCGAKSTVYC